MAKTKEELDALKEEVESVNEKLAELTPEEIAQVNGGGDLGKVTGNCGCEIFYRPGGGCPKKPVFREGPCATCPYY